MATADAVIVIDVVSVSALRPQSVAIVLEVQAARSSWVAVSESRYDAGKRTWTALSLPVAYCRNALPSNRVLMRIVAKGALLGLQFGTALLSFDDLLAQPSHQLLIQDALGNPTSVGSPMVPCEVTVGASAASLQQHGYVVPRPPASRSFPRHLFFMTRGTRGDVQPFVALAKGLANAHGWLVTICTELYWRDFVLSEVAELRAGAVHFLPSGGDTHAVTGQWTHQQVMKMQLDAIQQFINGAAEWGFFNSVPVFVHQLKRLQASAQPVDLLVCSFTTPGVGLLCSEACSVPMVNYCTQPGVIPTSDPAADPRLFKSQALMLLIKKGLESFVAPLFSASHGTPISLFKMRRQLGLPVSVDAWPTLVAQRVPVIIPMHPSTFTLPADWGEHVVCTDFIFLRGLQSNLQGNLESEIAAFVAHARRAGRKLCLITFSSMPVGRGAMLRVALKMIEESRHPLSVLYVGRLQPEVLSTALGAQLARCTLQGSFLEVAKGDFGVLFPQMDALIVHGGLGTTVEALRARKPVAVTGILMMDQLFWGQVCAAKGVGPPPSTIDEFQKGCVEFIDAALDPTSSYAQAAATLSYGDVDDDGVATNVRLLAQLLQGANLKPIVTAALAGPGAAARPSLCSDVLRVLNIVLPTAFANSLEYLPVLIGMAFVGHYCTKTELDAVALGRTYFNVVASAPGFGIITALRTLMPQAVGAGQQQLCALYLQRAFLFIALWGGVAVALAFQTTRVLTFLGQPAEASRLAQPYVLALMPQYVGVVGMSAIQRYYQALGLNYANLAICLLTFITAPALQWLFLVHFDMGYLGAAHAAAVYNTVYLVLQVPHLVCRGDGGLFVPHARTLQGRGLREYVWLMVPGLVMTLLEWWVLEALVLLSGRLQQSATAIAAFTLTAQVQSMGLMGWIGLAVAASMLIGQCIGAGDLQSARRLALITPLVGLALSAAAGLAVALLAKPIAALLATDEPIDELTAQLLPLVGGVFVVDAASNALQGVCSGLGMQRIAAYANLIGYYVVGLPLAVGLAYGAWHDGEDGVFGLWIGTGAALLAASLLQGVALLRHDWARAVEEARRRLGEEARGEEAPSRARGEEAAAAESSDAQERGVSDAMVPTLARMESSNGAPARAASGAEGAEGGPIGGARLPYLGGARLPYLGAEGGPIGGSPKLNAPPSLRPPTSTTDSMRSPLLSSQHVSEPHEGLEDVQIRDWMLSKLGTGGLEDVENAQGASGSGATSADQERTASFLRMMRMPSKEHERLMGINR